ncbi:MAG: DUF373 family protein [Nitrososphaerota archaeon]
MEGSGGSRTLILVVDEDDDIGRKTGWKTPILGRDKNFLAAKDLLLSDPEEADANAMFAAVKLYDELSKSLDGPCELATVAGKPGGGLDSDRKLAQEIDEVLSEFPADQCIVITDGPLTDSVNAIITSRVKVLSVRKLVVKQSPSIETTWILLGKYLRTALFEFLGIPGALAIIIGLLLQYNLLSPPILLVLFGAVLAVRGFGIDTAVVSFFRRVWTIPYRPALTQLRIYVGFSSALLMVAAIFAGINGITAFVSANFPNAPPFPEDPAFWIQRAGPLAGAFLLSSVDLVIVAASISLAYDLFYQLYLRSVRVVRSAQAIALAIFLWALFRSLGSYLVRGEEIYLTQMVLIAVMGVASLATIYVLLLSVGLPVLRLRSRGEAE